MSKEVFSKVMLLIISLIARSIKRSYLHNYCLRADNTVQEFWCILHLYVIVTRGYIYGKRDLIKIFSFLFLLLTATTTFLQHILTTTSSFLVNGLKL